MAPQPYGDDRDFRSLPHRRRRGAAGIRRPLRPYRSSRHDADRTWRLSRRRLAVCGRPQCFVALRGAGLDGGRRRPHGGTVHCRRRGVRHGRPVEARGPYHDGGASRGFRREPAARRRADRVRPLADAPHLLGPRCAPRAPLCRDLVAAARHEGRRRSLASPCAVHPQGRTQVLRSDRVVSDYDGLPAMACSSCRWAARSLADLVVRPTPSSTARSCRCSPSCRGLSAS